MDSVQQPPNILGFLAQVVPTPKVRAARLFALLLVVEKKGEAQIDAAASHEGKGLLLGAVLPE